MTRYEKLVRDRVPDIIRSKGTEPVTHVASPEEYARKLRAKLDEEVAEYDASGKPEELADVIEVLYAMAEHDGISRKQLDALREKKAAERGRFSERIILDES
jgi:predicted house-cleaning noncanonical NTP pyrophosphatase (MazG superfamily)